jgi:hypothetical protein
MILIDLQRAAIENALRTLEKNTSYQHPTAVILRIAGAEALHSIRQLRRELAAENKQYEGPAALSAEAQAYDREVRQLVLLGKRAQHSVNHALEMRVSQMSERLEESFEERVPEEDRPKFLKSEGDDRTWDDRWSYMEFRPPVLKSEFAGRPIEHPMHAAQRIVLAELASRGMEDREAATVRNARRQLESVLKLVRSGE